MYISYSLAGSKTVINYMVAYLWQIGNSLKSVGICQSQNDKDSNSITKELAVGVRTGALNLVFIGDIHN
jgi:hypothetical protein